MDRNPCAAGRGAALITAMLVVAVVTGVTVAMTSRQLIEIRRADNLLAYDRSSLALDQLEWKALAALRDDAATSRHDALTEAWAAGDFEVRIAGAAARGTLSDLQGRFNLNDMILVQGSAPGVAATPAAGGTVLGVERNGAVYQPRFGGGYDVQRADPATVPGEAPTAAAGGVAADPDPADRGGVSLSAQQLAVARFRLLLRNLDIEPDLVQAVLDWMDPDSETRYPNGAEDDYYLRRDSPYRSANRALASVRELLLIRGVSPAVFERLEPQVTVLPVRTAINLNTASKEILMSLGPGIDAAAADALIHARQAQPFLEIQAFQDHPAAAGRLLGVDELAVASQYFSLRSNLAAGRLNLAATSVLNRSGPDEARAVSRQRGYLDD